MKENTMFSHVMLGANDIDQAKVFYDAILGTLGIGPGVIDPKGRLFYMTKSGVFGLSKPIDGGAACGANGGTIGFNVDSPEQGDAWHAAGVASGGIACEDPPGVRENPGANMYLAYLRDPSGNKICALKRMP
jgi:catechol 2,3-dioxygenase-like lactoylglutathione lyase family enzyme